MTGTVVCAVIYLRHTPNAMVVYKMKKTVGRLGQVV